MRLIDADLLKQNCKITGEFNNNFQCVDLITLGAVIDNQPTAYDADKVVEQLENYIEDAKSKGDYSYIKPFQMAIEIVKAGGVDNGTD